MIKKYLAALLCLLFICSFAAVPTALADGYDMGSINEEFAIVVDAANPSVALYGMEKNADAMAYPASTTKILTCIIALERCSLDEVVTVSATATDFSSQNSLMGLITDEQCTMRDLLYGLMLVSGNDAAVAIAEHISGSQDAFSDLMNSKAREIGMTNSNFITPNGRHKDEHYTTARDMAILTAYALQNTTFCEIVGTVSYTTEQTNKSASRTMQNSNRLLVDLPASDGYTPVSCLYEDAIGVKTGDTDKAGKCLVAAAERDGVTLIAVLLNGSQTNSTMTTEERDARNARRFQDAAALFNYAFDSMVETVAVSELITLGLPTTFQLQANNYAESDAYAGQFDAAAQIDSTLTISLMSNAMSSLKSRLSELAVVKTSTIYAPVRNGDIVGTVDYVFEDRVLFSANLIASRDVAEGVIATTPLPTDTASELQTADPSSGTTGLISSPTSTPGTSGDGEGDGSWLLYLVIGAVILVLLLIVAVLIIRAVNERKRRLAREKRRRQMQRRMQDQQRVYRDRQRPTDKF
ncbi:MAG: D-alanyl-D-alanine carboxypeptidase family protein [Clostridia bacterium]|nr:D-alanyl-D-alanine carboxypeptidase family protein [Clostridia bacterium]